MCNESKSDVLIDKLFGQDEGNFARFGNFFCSN